MQVDSWIYLLHNKHITQLGAHMSTITNEQQAAARATAWEAVEVVEVAARATAWEAAA